MIQASDLRTIPMVSDLPEDQLQWLAQHSEEIRAKPGEVMFREGDPAEYMYAFLEGELEARSERPSDGVSFHVQAGDITGLLPFSRLQKFMGTGRAVTPLRVARFHKRMFPDLIHKMPVLTERLVGRMLDRVRDYTKLGEQRDKLAALGKLSAGLAHELNNPAAAVKRASGTFFEVRRELRAAFLRLDQQSLSREQRTYIVACEDAGLAAMQNPGPITSLERSDREQALETWMDAHRIPEPWKLTPVLVEAQFDAAKLEEIAKTVGADALPDVLIRVNYSLLAARMVKEIDHGASRIFELVQAIKEYTYMDQAPEQEIDIHAGIESTLTILAYKLRNKSIEVEREFDREIPKICAHGVELNQVWTNLIVNAIEAMPQGGRLQIRTCQDPGSVIVDVEDNGSGIPADALPHIFEPFFTTKGVGEGTGLGLDTAMRVVQKHRGDLTVRSNPGATIFRVVLPKQRAAQAAS